MPYEGLLWVWIDGEWRRAGVWYDHRRNLYNYHCDEQSYDPNKRVWRRTSTAIDEAIFHHLQQKVRATFDSERWRASAAEQLALAESEQRRLQAQVEALERSMEDVVSNLMSLRLPPVIAQLEQSYAQMESERKWYLSQIAALESSNRLSILSPFEELLTAIDNWQLLTRDEQRKIVLLLIQRIEIPHFIPHRALTLRIIWFDDSVTELTVRRSQRQDQVWTLAELDTLISLVNAGATQLEIARALPKRKWENIRRQIRLHCGLGLCIPEVGVVRQSESYDDHTHRVGGTQSNSTPN